MTDQPADRDPKFRIAMWVTIVVLVVPIVLLIRWVVKLVA